MLRFLWGPSLGPRPVEWCHGPVLLPQPSARAAPLRGAALSRRRPITAGASAGRSPSHCRRSARRGNGPADRGSGGAPRALRRRGPKPGSQNAWNDFQKSMAGSGLSRAELRRLYRERAGERARGPERAGSWNAFQQRLKGRGLSNGGLAALYRRCGGDADAALRMLSAEPRGDSPTDRAPGRGSDMGPRAALGSAGSLATSAGREPPSPTRGPGGFGTPPRRGSEAHRLLPAACLPPGAGSMMPSDAFEALCLPNLGYACSNWELRAGSPSVHLTRRTTREGFRSRGLAYVSALALCNCRDLVKILRWNESAGIRFFRVPIDIFPWCDSYELQDLPDYGEIAEVLAGAGRFAARHGHRITCHAPHFVKLASPDSGRVASSVVLLERHAQLLDLMGFAPSVRNKINIHVGGVYGCKKASLRRLGLALSLLSSSCRSRLTVENDDSPRGYSVKDLLPLSLDSGVPIVFDALHHRFCDGGLSHEAALKLAVATWPKGVRPVVHWSEARDGRRRGAAHSDLITEPMRLHGLDASVDVMVEAKACEQAVLRYREMETRRHLTELYARLDASLAGANPPDSSAPGRRLSAVRAAAPAALPGGGGGARPEGQTLRGSRRDRGRGLGPGVPARPQG
mmetsp:Transcript_1720/g.4018  ORF Transcript_1720/g.4018 Transcript_1720/m.4018 type:complete len:629 (-) Transcript_1720:131-2017(-)